MLTDTQIRNTKPAAKPQKLFDGGGLYLLVTPEGGRWWRLKYRYQGKEKLLSLGTYPEVPLAGRKDKKSGTWIDGARDKRDAARQLLANDVDPGARRKAEKAAGEQAAANSFEVVAREWHEKRRRTWVEATADNKLKRLELDVFPVVGKRPIGELNAADLLPVLRRIEARGAHEIARRVRQILGSVFRYAIATSRATRDPAADLRDALVQTKETHRAAITNAQEAGALLRAIDGFQGEPVTRAALRLAPLVFVRPGELRAATWDEIDLDAAEWRIPAERMKMRIEHVVPLSRQAIAILRELQPFTGRGIPLRPEAKRFVFPGVRTPLRCMSENTINAALRRLGYTTEQMTGHGFRAMASTLLHEHGQWPSDVIERQLAHQERNKVKGAYNRAGHLSERRKMMQWWADYLDQLREGAKVIPIARKV